MLHCTLLDKAIIRLLALIFTSGIIVSFIALPCKITHQTNYSKPIYISLICHHVWRATLRKAQNSGQHSS